LKNGKIAQPEAHASISLGGKWGMSFGGFDVARLSS